MLISSGIVFNLGTPCPVELTQEVNLHVGAHSSLETWEGPVLPMLLLGQCWQGDVSRGGAGVAFMTGSPWPKVVESLCPGPGAEMRVRA